MMPEAGKGKKKAKTFDRIEYPRPAVTAIPIARGGVPHTSRLVWAPASHSAGRLRCRRWGPAGGWRSPAPPGAAPPPGPPRGHPPPLRWGDRRGLRIPKSLWRGPRQGGRGRRPAGEKHQTKREKNRHTKWGKNTSKRNFPTRCFPEAFAHQSVSAASDLCPRTVVVTAGQAPGRHRELGEGHQLQRRAGLQGDLAPVERGVLCVRLHVEVPNDGQGGGHCWQGSTCRRHCGSSDLRPPVLSGSLQKELWLSEPGKYLQDGVSLICGVVRKRKENIQAHHNGKCTGKKNGQKMAILWQRQVDIGGTNARGPLPIHPKHQRMRFSAF